MTYAVVLCPSCKRAKAYEVGRKTTQCAHCSRTLKLEHLKVFHRTDDLAEAQAAMGELNARYGGIGATQEFRRAIQESNEPETRPIADDDPWAPVHRAARAETGEQAKADAVALALTRTRGAFREEDLAEAFERVGLKRAKAETHLKRMLATHRVYEPRPGEYQALEG